MIRGERRKPTKVGTMTVVDAETGKVVETKRNAMTMLPCRPDVCQECAVDHAHDQPHNQQSLYYRVKFQAEHGRAPTWTDAMAHCSPEVRAQWRPRLIEQMQKHGLPIPDDLTEPEERPHR
jgi:hypothetical protein